MSLEKICVPDIGDTAEVEVIEVLVKEGQSLQVDETLAVLESDKASMDIPSPQAGVVKKVHLKVGDKVLEGHLILELETASQEQKPDKNSQSTKTHEEKSTAQTSVHDIILPDLGTDEKVSIIEIPVQVGDKIQKDQTLLTLESDKASMDVPSEFDGILQTLSVTVGQSAQTGDNIGQIAVEGSQVSDKKVELPAQEKNEEESSLQKNQEPQNTHTLPERTPSTQTSTEVYAGPAARKLARDLGLELTLCHGTGKRGRILVEDVALTAKKLLENKQNSAQPFQASRKVPDFEKFGPIEKLNLSRIKQKTAQNLQLTVQTVPQVTQFDKADITNLEEFRQEHKKSISDQGGKLTMILFVMKALVATMKKYPQFNSSLSECGTQLIQKKYFHLGVAVDTPAGLVVPVIENVDKKSILELSQEIVQLSQSARQGKLKASQMQGSCMTISSLGGIGGTAFTPIVNWPDVAILGLSASMIEPFYNGQNFVPRTFLPLSLSYDHRVIDGAEAARFIVDLKKNLEDLRRVLFV